MFDEYFEALEKFWNIAVQGDGSAERLAKADAVLVLPKNYGYGMRYTEDKIWGFWGPDEVAPLVWIVSQKLLSQHGFSLDIVYDDSVFPFKDKYEVVYYWNSTL